MAGTSTGHTNFSKVYPLVKMKDSFLCRACKTEKCVLVNWIYMLGPALN